MDVKYLVEITEAQIHMVRIILSAKRELANHSLEFFLPCWSPGSYLMREYAKNIRSLRVVSGLGEYLYFEQMQKSLWQIDWSKSDVKDQEYFAIEYEVYCHELTVRTSHIDLSHAFLHGPSYLMGIKDIDIKPVLELRFPHIWSKVHTGLTELSSGGDKYVFAAASYDELIDAPIEIGCHDSDGFIVQGKEHHLAFYGKVFHHHHDLKKDIKIIVEHIANTVGEIPYDKYVFITHFVPDIYGGLEHLNSTALHFDGRKLNNREDYLNWLSLVAHEYFHTWNVKRIRPRELGPFDYLNENYTTMHWLTEGLTSFVDDWFIYRAGLSNLTEYLKIVKNNLNRYLQTPGRKFHSLEQSSFNAWIKLYRPDENTHNSSISYYLKGGLVFLVLHILLRQKSSGVEHIISDLWQLYKQRPERGLESEEVFRLISSRADSEVLNIFTTMISTTEEIDFEKYLKRAGVETVWNGQQPSLGVSWISRGDRLIIDKVDLDGAAYKSGLNAGDEVIAIAGQRITVKDKDLLANWIVCDQAYEFTISRNNFLLNLEVYFEAGLKLVKELKITDQKKAEEVFSPLLFD